VSRSVLRGAGGAIPPAYSPLYRRDGAAAAHCAEALARFKAKVRELTRRTRGRSLAQIVKELSVYLVGWRGYFGFCQTPSALRDLDQWSSGCCALTPGNNGSAAALVLQSCDAAVSAGIWRRNPPAAHMAPGGSRTVPHC